jgi:ATP/maltotriose-dependent transcriptional regulator MalT
VLNNLSIIERHQANLNDARRDIERALATFQKAGSQQGVLIATNNLANIHWERGDLAKAVEMDRQSLKLSREMDDKLHECSALGNLAGLLQLQGKLSEARETYEQALRLATEMEDREGMGLNQGNLADLLYRQGDLQAARKMAEDAAQTDRETGVKSLEGYALYQLAEVLAAQGDTNAAKSKFDESAKLRHELHEAVTEAESRLAIAQIELDTHEPRAAEQTLRSLVDVFHSGDSIDNEALSYSLLAMAFAEQGNTGEMEQALAKSRELLRKTRDAAVQLEAQINIAFAPAICSRSAESKPALHAPLVQAAKQLESAKEKARQLGYVGLELKARERLAELELRRGDTPTTRAHLKDVQRDAEAKGFTLIAKQVAAL